MSAEKFKHIRDSEAYRDYVSWSHSFYKGSFDKGEQIVYDWLKDHFKSTNRGIIIDVGANDGVTQSHSLPFIEKGWRAILIEPHPKLFQVIEKIYAGIDTVQMVQNAVHNAATAEVVLFSGYTPSLGHSTLLTPTQQFRADESFINNEETYTVVARRLTDILHEVKCKKQIDILHIDAEGFGIEALKSLDFEAFHPKVISVDVSTENFDPLAPALRQFMEQHNYDFVLTAAQSVWSRRE